MIKIDNLDILSNQKMYLAAYNSSSNAPFLEDAFIRKSYPILEKRANRSYPYEVRIPKSFNEMLRGDFEPSRVVVVKEPFQGPYGNMWFGDASSGVSLRCGYVNGDSRYIHDFKLGDSDIHMFLAGATGQGKSVTLKAIIFGIAYEFAPWSVRFTLTDAKIVEFKNLAKSTPLPHIGLVAATSDVDYLISVLDDKRREMLMVNEIFTKATSVFGSTITKIEEFISITNLILPQNIIVMDECTAMFANAGKRANELAIIIKDFAALGRNSGYHLLMSSQEVTSDIPTAAFDNIKARAALGCTAAVSEKLLGNDQAKLNYGKKGTLLFNVNPEGKNKLENVLVKVPFMPGDQVKVIADSIINQGKKWKLDGNLKLYDEKDILYETEYDSFLDRMNLNKHRLYLGEPSFVLHDPEGEECIKLEFKGKSMENICILSHVANHLLRYFRMLFTNIRKLPEVANIVLCVNDLFNSDGKAEQLSPKQYYESGTYENNDMFQVVRSLLYRRKLCLAADALVFKEVKYTETSDKIFYEQIAKGTPEDTVINRCRCFYIIGLLNQDAVMRHNLKLDVRSKEEHLRAVRKHVITCIRMFSAYKSVDTKLTIEKIPVVYAWVLGIDLIMGLGRDPKARNIEEIKKLLYDCSTVNMRFIFAANSMLDMSELASSIRWFLLDDTMQQQLSRIKCADYPAQKSAVLGVLWDQQNAENPCSKFKKMLLDGEILSSS